MDGISAVHLSLPLLIISLSALSANNNNVIVSAADWNYEQQGNDWPKEFAQFCNGRRQSPVNLGISHSQFDPDLIAFEFTEETGSGASTLTATNNGHTLVLTWSDERRISMKIRDSDVIYKAAQLHWHWGSSDQVGSEHTVNNGQYAAEAHLVFYNSYDYHNFSHAVSSVGGLAVIGVFLEASADLMNPLLSSIDGLIMNTTLQTANGEVTMRVQANELKIIDGLLPSNKQDFYRYDGSLTTPGCYETVLWTVLKQAMPISESQLQVLRSLKFSDNKPMVDNYRAVQPMNSNSRPGSKRILFRSFNSAPGTGSPGSGIVAATLSFVMMATMNF